MIPKTSPKPEDGRTRKCKAGGKPAYFRFPLLINREENDFYPVLSGDEKLLRGAELDYYACEFETAQAAFEDLLRNTQSIYIEIMALYYLCSLSVWVYGGKDFKIHYSRLLLALAGDFPYKKRWKLCCPCFIPRLCSIV